MRGKTGIKGMLNMNLRTLKSKNSLKTRSIWNIWKLFSSKGLSYWQRTNTCCCSVAVVSDSLWSHGLQHARLPCPSLSRRVCSNSCPLSPWCHPTISSSVSSCSSCSQSFLASGYFPMSRLFASGNQSIRASASNEYSWLISFSIDWLDLLVIQGALKSLLQHRNSKASFLWGSAFCMIQLSHPYMTTRKTITLTIWTFVGK